MKSKEINESNEPDNIIKEEDADRAPHILHLTQLAKNLYINHGIELTAISEMFKKHMTLAKIVEFKDAQKWDEERDKLLKIKNTLYGSAKQLVKMTLAVARIDPTANNISAYKRAIESLIVLKRTMPAKNSQNKNDLKITPEHIAEFADAAGLDYTPDPAVISEPGLNDACSQDDELNIGVEK